MTTPVPPKFSSQLEKRGLSDSEKEEIAKVYNHFASVILRDGTRVMNLNDFLRSLTTVVNLKTGEIERTLELKSPKKFQLLFRIADIDGVGYLTRPQYEALHWFVLTSNNEYQVAFKLFDQSADGVLSFPEFVQMIEHMDSGDSDAVPFNFDSEWLSLFFGHDHTQTLSYPAFTQMMKGLSGEKAKQEFLHYDTERRGYIPVASFVKIAKRMTKGKFPSSFTQRLSEIALLDPHHEGVVSFAEFMAFQSFIVHFPSYLRVAKYASSVFGDELLSKELFLRCAQPPATSIDISPLEVDLLFHWFADPETGLLSLEPLEEVTETLGSSTARPALTSTAKKETFFDQLRNAGANFCLGAIAGGVGATAVYPIDLVKTRMQAQISAKDAELLYRNSFDCFKKVLTREGPRALYRGLGPQLVGVAPEKAIKLTVNDYLRKLFGRAAPNPDGKMYLPLEILAGGGAGASQVIFTNPLEIVKIRLQMQGEGGVARRGAMAIVRELGLTGLYKGASACFLRDIPFSMIYFPTYAGLKDHLASKNEDGKPRSEQILLAGTLAGAPSAGLCTPADVIKTRLQLEARAGHSTYSGIRDCFWKILEHEGPRAFWKGATARMFRSSPQFGVTLLTYEKLQHLLFPSVELRPPTNVPIAPQDLIQTHMLRAVERVETKWDLSA